MTISTPTTRPGRWISMLLIVLGAIGIVYGVGSGVVRGFASHAATSDTFTADVEGVDELQIDSSATAFEIRFGDVDQATLDVTTTRPTPSAAAASTAIRGASALTSWT